MAMPYHESRRSDRFTLKVYCQHCGQYLTTIVGVEREHVPSVRAELRELAQQHADEVGRAIEVTFYVTLQRSTVFTPSTSQ
jgi:hypothetical protein